MSSGKSIFFFQIANDLINFTSWLYSACHLPSGYNTEVSANALRWHIPKEISSKGLMRNNHSSVKAKVCVSASVSVPISINKISCTGRSDVRHDAPRWLDLYKNEGALWWQPLGQGDGQRFPGMLFAAQDTAAQLSAHQPCMDRNLPSEFQKHIWHTWLLMGSQASWRCVSWPTRYRWFWKSRDIDTFCSEGGYCEAKADLSPCKFSTLYVTDVFQETHMATWSCLFAPPAHAWPD